MPASATHRPRILVVENGISITGSVVSVLRSSVRLQEHFDFVFLLPSGSGATSVLKACGFAVFEMPMKEVRRNLFSLIAYLPMLIFNTISFVGLVRKQMVDVIHSNDFYNLLPSVYKMFGGKIPYVVHVRFMPSRFPKVYLDSLCVVHRLHASAILTVSAAARNELKSIHNVTIIPDGLPLGETVYTKPQSKVILYPSNFTRGKGQDYALIAFTQVAEKYPEWKLRFVGGTLGLSKNQHYKNELVKLADELGVAERIEWKEFTDDMGPEYAHAAFVLNFSDSESFSLTCQESLFFGRPVISVDSGGPAEIIDNDETGFLIQKGNIDEMKTRIEFLIENPDKRATMGMKGQVKMKQRFGPEETIRLLKEVYTKCLLAASNSAE